MAKSKHMKKRMSERNVREEDYKATKQFGAKRRERLYLTNKGCDAVLKGLDDLIKMVRRAEEKGAPCRLRLGDKIIKIEWSDDGHLRLSVTETGRPNASSTNRATNQEERSNV